MLGSIPIGRKSEERNLYMGSIKLVLNIDRVDLIVATAVVIIAFIAIVGLIAWFVKTGKQHKTLKQIDNKLTPKKPEIVIREIIRNDTSKVAEPKKEKVIANSENIDDEAIDDETDEVDVLAEIQKMMVAQEKACDDDIIKEKGNVGKSGKSYTRDEIEKLIND